MFSGSLKFLLQCQPPVTQSNLTWSYDGSSSVPPHNSQTTAHWWSLLANQLQTWILKWFWKRGWCQDSHPKSFWVISTPAVKMICLTIETLGLDLIQQTCSRSTSTISSTLPRHGDIWPRGGSDERCSALAFILSPGLHTDWEVTRWDSGIGPLPHQPISGWRLAAPPPFDSASFNSAHRASVLPVCSLLLLLSGKLSAQLVDTPAAAATRQPVGVSHHFSDWGWSGRAGRRGRGDPTSDSVYQLSCFSQSAALRGLFLSRSAPFSFFFFPSTANGFGETPTAEKRRGRPPLGARENGLHLPESRAWKQHHSNPWVSPSNLPSH